MTLSRTQLSLLRAMKSGIRLNFTPGRGGYFSLADTHVRCTQAAMALLTKKMIKETDNGFSLTEEGIKAAR